MQLEVLKESEIDNKPWGGQFSCSIRLHRLNKLKKTIMSTKTLEYNVHSIFHKELKTNVRKKVRSI